MDNETKKLAFCRDEGQFVAVLKERVDQYFKSKSLSQKANLRMYCKSIFLLSLVALAYAAILSGIGGGLGVFGLYILLGLFVSFNTMNIAHDALHGAYVHRSVGNRILGLMMDLSGASSFYWKKEHVIDHHTFTNIAEFDADLDVPFLLRLCPKAPLRPFHRFQHLYAPILYSLNILHWVYVSDMKRIYYIFAKKDLGSRRPSNLEVFLMVFFKLIHIGLFLVIPVVTLALPWWQVVLGYIAYLCTAGLTLTTIFQLAHIVENVDFPLPNEEGKMENSFVKHQLATTSNFAMQNKFISFLFGGLNFQVEHHIFPQICHYHLNNIAPIVQQTAKEFGVPYHHQPSFIRAIISHFSILKKLGRSQ